MISTRAGVSGMALLFLVFSFAPAAHAQNDDGPPTVPAKMAVVVDGVTINGPPPPELPETIVRDAQGRVTIRAVRIDEPVRLDGRLDEAVYSRVRPAAGFVQSNPNPGAPATEATEAWIFFDGDTLYVGARCWDSAPEERWVANELRRDSNNIPNNENFAITFDTFYDRRNAFLFEVSAIGGLYDAHVANERGGGVDWSPPWDSRAGRFEGGWTVEMAIPFRSLRYQPGTAQIWGVNIRRKVRWKNEESFIIRMPPTQGTGIAQISLGGTLVGIDAPSGGKNLEIKPYAISSVATDRRANPAVSNDLDADAGFDVKYGLTQNLTADFTYNTDFAQVELDDQQVNLTRFNLLFPEKREFFLEGQGIFEIGGAGGAAVGGAGDGATPLLFFSRRIGLNQNRAVPIDAGGRLTGKIGKFSVGVLDVRTGDDNDAGTPATNFSVVRVRRDILRRSSIGMLFTGRSKSARGGGSSESYAVDASIGLFDNLNINTYLAKTVTPELSGDDVSYRTQINYNGDRYGVQVERLMVGDNFNPEVGFLQRDDFARSFASVRFSPRPTSIRSVRKFSYTGSYEYITDSEGRLETRETGAQFGIEFQNSDRFSIGVGQTYDFLARPFTISTRDGVTLPIGAYEFGDGQLSMTFGNQRRMSGSISISHGTFYNGHRTTASNKSLIELSPRFSLEPGVSFNWIDLEQGSFRTSLVSTRATFTVTPRMFFSGLLQYNSSNVTLGSNLRLRWEYHPGSELFVVYTDERDTDARQLPGLRNRAFIVKINRLVRF